MTAPRLREPEPSAATFRALRRRVDRLERKVAPLEQWHGWTLLVVWASCIVVCLTALVLLARACGG